MRGKGKLGRAGHNRLSVIYQPVSMYVVFITSYEGIVFTLKAEIPFKVSLQCVPAV